MFRIFFSSLFELNKIPKERSHSVSITILSFILNTLRLFASTLKNKLFFCPLKKNFFCFFYFTILIWLDHFCSKSDLSRLTSLRSSFISSSYEEKLIDVFKLKLITFCCRINCSLRSESFNVIILRLSL